MRADIGRVELETSFLDRPIVQVLLISAMIAFTFLAACFILLPW
jgi:hypothetical protein